MNPITICVLFASFLSLMVTTSSAREWTPIIDESKNAADIPEDQLDFEEWKEHEFALPDYPNDDDLLEFQVDEENQRFTYYIDQKSLSLGDEGVTRYTLVLESKTGARNVFYEGLRCITREYRSYAFGAKKGELKAIKGTTWKPVVPSRTTRYRTDLLEIYLCRATLPRSPEQAINAIKRQGSVVHETPDHLFFN